MKNILLWEMRGWAHNANTKADASAVHAVLLDRILSREAYLILGSKFITRCLNVPHMCV
jgi:hypothetical protein